MDNLYVLVGYMIGFVAVIGLIALVSSRVSHGEGFGPVEKLVAAYLACAVVAWIIEGFRGTSVIAAIVPALKWPVDVYLWIAHEAREAGG